MGRSSNNFRAFLDKTSTGRISLQEVWDAVRIADQGMKKKHMKQIFTDTDTNEDRSLDNTEFRAATCECNWIKP